MSPAVRKVVAVVTGVVVAFALVAAIETAGHAVYPIPGDMDFKDPEKVRSYIQGLPLGALLFVLAAWTLASFVGGLVAALIARTRPVFFAGIVGGCVLAATVANLLMLPHPAWFAALGIVGIVVAAYAAGRVAAARTAG